MAEWLLETLKRANRIASTTQLDDLLEQMLELIVQVCEGYAGTLFLLDAERDELVFKIVMEGASTQRLTGRRISARSGIAGATLLSAEPLLIEDLENEPRWNRSISQGTAQPLKSMISIPLMLNDRPIGVVQVYNFRRAEVEIVQLLANRMASEVEKAILLAASRERSQRLGALVSIIGQIGSSLDRDQILKMIIGFACQLLGAEASSLFLVDEETGDLRLHVATSAELAPIQSVRVPAGKGIIGCVVQTGETVLVPNVQTDPRYYQEVDLLSGFETRSILAVPLRTRPVALGQERGQAQEKITGGLEAINKMSGVFTAEDALLLETLAIQAGTVLQVADLYAGANELSLGVIRTLSAAIDAKDPCTEGHSQRVSDFSVAMARQMDLGPEIVHHVRIAGLLHDIGKIGVPDQVLNKPGRLTKEEYLEIQKHPEIGARILSSVRTLKVELPAIAEHHEWINGQGYPRALQGEDISLIARIVAVADVFDALTSHRPYRQALPAHQVLVNMAGEAGSHFDPHCISALQEAYNTGKIQVQRDRQNLDGAPGCA